MISFFRRTAPKDQADRLRDLVRDAGLTEPKPVDGGDYAGPPLIVVAGSKGGVGTTTLAFHLAKALAEAGVKCVAVDANLRQADLGQVAEVTTEGPNISHVMSGKSTADDAVQFLGNGLSLLAGAWAPDAHPQATGDGVARLLTQLATLGERADAIVIDAGSSHTPAAAPLWKAAKKVLLVATAEKLSLLGAYAAIKLAGATGERPPIDLLVNRAASSDQANRIHQQVGKTCQRFLGAGVPLAGYVGEELLASHSMLVARKLAKLCRPADKRVSNSPSPIELAAA
ncbi:MAG: AAA family ATPase [Planctomycetota bacterium]